MIILHVSSITNNKASGMSIVVPLHVKYQNLHAETALLNCNNTNFAVKDENIITFNSHNECRNGDITKLPAPFNLPDLVVFHGIYIPFYLKIMKWLVKKAIPYVIVPHGSLSVSAQKIKPLKKAFGNVLLFNKLIKNSIAIQYLSEEEKKTSVNNESKGFIGCNGMDIKSLDKKFRGLKESFNIIYIGRLDPFHKGLDILIDAANLIKNEMRKRNITLFLYGPDHNNGVKSLKSLVEKHNISDIVKLNDAIYGDMKIRKLLDAELFVQTSRFEGQPLGVMEALAIGLPVLITPGTNMAQEVKDNECGWVAEFSAEDIAKKIIESHTDREKLYHYSNKALTFMNETYDWKKVAYEAVAEYKSLVDK